MTLLEMSLSGGAIIAVTALVRLLLRDRLPRRMYIVLWDLAMLRLLVPFRLPSPTSVQGAVRAAAPVAPPAAAAMQPTAPAVQAAGTRAAGAVQAAQAAGAAAQGGGFPLRPVLLALWLAVGLALAARFALVYVRGLRAFAQSLPCDDPAVCAFLRRHPLARPVQVRVSGRIASPLSYGILHPVILLPRGMDRRDTRALFYVLMHEWQHIRALDAVRKLAAAACLCVHWMNPLVCVMFLLVSRDMELLCDERVVGHRGRAARRAYARTLLDMEEQRQRLMPTASGFSVNAMEERIQAMTNMKKRGAASVLAAVMIVVGTGAALATSAPQQEQQSAAQAGASAPGQTSAPDSIMPGTAGRTAGSAQSGPDVVWWTAEEYAAYVEEQRAVLQEMVDTGVRGYTQSDGWFVWTQERMDEAMATYESVLEELRSGKVRVSKTVDGSDELALMQSIPDEAAMESATETVVVESVAQDIGTSGGDRGTIVESAVGAPTLTRETWNQYYAKYEPYGLGYDWEAMRLTFGGRVVRTFEDMYPLDQSSMAGTVMQYPDGEVDVYAVRDLTSPIVRNADGSFDPSGTLLGLREATQEEFDARTREIEAAR